MYLKALFTLFLVSAVSCGKMRHRSSTPSPYQDPYATPSPYQETTTNDPYSTPSPYEETTTNDPYSTLSPYEETTTNDPYSTPSSYQETTRATCRMANGGIEGVITLEQTDVSSPVNVTGTLQGLKPGSHGFHVYEFGNVTEGCYCIGGHFNPYNKYHGGPSDKNRHVGDLGNIEANEKGEATIDIQDSLISLGGHLSVVGRALGVTEREDDLGRTKNPESKKTGNSGAVISCCVIELC